MYPRLHLLHPLCAISLPVSYHQLSSTCRLNIEESFQDISRLPSMSQQHTAEMAGLPTTELDMAPPSGGSVRGDEAIQTYPLPRPVRATPGGFTVRSWDDCHDPRLCEIIDAVPGIHDWASSCMPSRVEPEILNGAAWMLSAVSEPERMAFEATYGWAPVDGDKKADKDGREGSVCARDGGVSPLHAHTTTTKSTLEPGQSRKRRRSSTTPVSTGVNSRSELARRSNLSAAPNAAKLKEEEQGPKNEYGYAWPTFSYT